MISKIEPIPFALALLTISYLCYILHGYCLKTNTNQVNVSGEKRKKTQIKGKCEDRDRLCCVFYPRD